MAITPNAIPDYNQARLKAWVQLKNGDKKNLVVFGWGNSETKRRYMFRKNRELITNRYHGAFAKVIFYDKQNGGREIGHMDEFYNYHGEVAMMA